jgi:DNA-binding transcriptional LysR family regulator
MDYAAWKLFIDAAELGSLSKVALAYGTSQPHISRRIGELEQECGGRLFHRTGRGVMLTELGQHIAPKVRGWLTSTEQLLNDVRTSAGTPIGKVRIGSLPSTAHPLVTTLHRRLAEQYPLVQLAVREGQGAQLETWLEDGQCRSCDPVADQSIAQGRRYLPRQGPDPPHECDRRPADVWADGTLLGPA